jgi:hypothetical protein
MRIRKMLQPGILPTAWASSYSRKGWVRTHPLFGAALATLLVPSPLFAPVQAQPVVTSAAKPPPACATEDHRAFDFWIGVWDVTAAGKDQAAAVNSISREHGGCVLHEDYATKGGYTGMSMSFYDAAQEKWHQTWMGADGSALFIEGGLNDQGEMVLSNRNTPYYREGMPINRVTWTPNEDGSVRQHWQASQDGGMTWSTVFDGLYVKKR